MEKQYTHVAVWELYSAPIIGDDDPILGWFSDSEFFNEVKLKDWENIIRRMNQNPNYRNCHILKLP